MMLLVPLALLALLAAVIAAVVITRSARRRGDARGFDVMPPPAPPPRPTPLGGETTLGITPEWLAGRRFRFLPEADRSVIAGIDCGVLFVMAFWSPPARQAFVALKRVLAEVDPQGRLELVVVDTDGCPDLYAVPEFAGKIHGAGETAWVSGGRIVATSGLRFRPWCFEPNTRALLDRCPA